jgi:hypothetical protein
MSGEEYPGPVHEQVTENNHLRYFFYDKHHAPHNTADAQWLPSMSRVEEFAVFNQADLHQIVAPNGDLFGMRRTQDGRVLPLGTEQQEIAEFPFTRSPGAWHGYPLWPLKSAGDDRNRLPVPNFALRLMVECGWITFSQKRRLSAGKNTS